MPCQQAPRVIFSASVQIAPLPGLVVELAVMQEAGEVDLRMLNESAAKNHRVVPQDGAVGYYRHVDDGLILTDSNEKASRFVREAADALASVGFALKHRCAPEAVAKVVGYEVQRKPPVTRFLLAKGDALMRAMLWLVSCDVVDFNTVHSLLGIWVFGALLGHDVLAAAGHIFAIVEQPHDCAER